MTAVKLSMGRVSSLALIWDTTEIVWKKNQVILLPYLHLKKKMLIKLTHFKENTFLQSQTIKRYQATKEKYKMGKCTVLMGPHFGHVAPDGWYLGTLKEQAAA